MTWARLDDSFPEHPKVEDLTAEAFRLHVTAICYCARNLTDGVLRNRWLRANAPKKLSAELQTAGLWDEHPLGLLVHDYLDFNPSREKVMAERAKRSVAGKAGANNRWHGKSHSSGDNKSEADGMADTIDIPDAPVPSPPSGSKDPLGTARKRAATKKRTFSPEFVAKCEEAEPTLDIPAFQEDYLNWGGSKEHLDIEAGFRSQLRIDWKRRQFTKPEYRADGGYRPQSPSEPPREVKAIFTGWPDEVAQ